MLKKCKLWQADSPSKSDFVASNFKILKTYADDSHLLRQLRQCRECGQLYFYEFYEEIDWVNGNDPQYLTLIPVETTLEAERFKKLSPLEILRFSPRLQSDWPADQEKPRVYWVGR